MTQILLLCISILLIAACGLFVAAEFSLLSVQRSTVERLAQKGDQRAQGIARALSSLSTQLSSAQIGITITNLVIGFLAEPAIAHFLHAPLHSFGLSGTTETTIATITGISLATILTMVYGELVPKNIAIVKPLDTAAFIQRPLQIFTSVLRLPIQFLNASANFILRQFGVAPQEELASARSADELLSLVRRSAQKGTLAKETAQMLERSLTFGDLSALDVMTPRVQVHSVQAQNSLSDVLDLARRSGLSRFPVWAKTPDDIVGIIHIKHILAVPAKKRAGTVVERIMRPPVLVPSTIELEPLLAALRRGGLQMAVVIDEFGGMDGIVTMEDLLEELVGEVHDEHDRSRPIIRKRKDGSYLVSGLLRPDEIGEELGIFLPEGDDVETLGGLIVQQLERIPHVHDSTQIRAIDRDGKPLLTQLTVERMDGNRIDRVKMTAEPVKDAGEDTE